MYRWSFSTTGVNSTLGGSSSASSSFFSSVEDGFDWGPPKDMGADDEEEEEKLKLGIVAVDALPNENVLVFVVGVVEVVGAPVNFFSGQLLLKNVR